MTILTEIAKIADILYQRNMKIIVAVLPFLLAFIAMMAKADDAEVSILNMCTDKIYDDLNIQPINLSLGEVYSTSFLKA